MSSLNTTDDSKSALIKIEVKKVSDGSSSSIAECKNATREINLAVRKIDVTTANSNNPESAQGETSAQGHNEAFRDKPFTEVPIIGIRYFKGIGESNPTETSHVGESLPDKPSVPVTIEVDPQVILTPPSVGQKESAGNLNKSHILRFKPLTYEDLKYGKVELYAPDTGPKIYNVKGNIITRPIITKNLPEAFRALPIHGKPENKARLKDFFEQKIRDYVGYGISDNEFAKLQEFMDGDYLRNGLECTTTYSFPSQGPLSVDLKSSPLENGPGQNLCIVKKLQLRLRKDMQNHYPKKLKYRGLRMLPLSLGDDEHTEIPASSTSDVGGDGPLEPGRDLIFRARMYRPHSYGSKDHRDRKPTRHSVFNNDLVVLGRQRLTAVRDRIACANDIGMRVDVSDNPDCFTTESAKQMFPSGFLFINNVFYVDTRAGCVDHSAGIREWARRRRLGDFPVRDMAAVRLDQLVLRLGHPEVYVHQGKCEHLFTFSEVRLLGADEPLREAHYPCFTSISQNQSVYCTTCAEFGAKWIVVGCSRVPFDPAFFCDTCFRFYLYDRNGKKIGDFKAYSYKGNTVNFLKPIVGLPGAEEAPSGNEEESE